MNDGSQTNLTAAKDLLVHLSCTSLDTYFIRETAEAGRIIYDSGGFADKVMFMF